MSEKSQRLLQKDDGADAFVQPHSITDTAKKNGMSRFDAVCTVEPHGAEAICL